MATLDYKKRLESLQNRKFDRDINESVLSKSFSRTDFPENVKYLMESMLPIESNYNNKTIEAAQRVQNHLEKGLNLHYSRAYRNQGSVMTGTNIKVHSDFDLLAIVDRYYYVAPDVPNNYPYILSDPNADIKALRNQSTTILKNIYDDVDTSGTKSISIFNKSLNRKVDVVFCFWYNTSDYEKAKSEYYRGIYLFDFIKEVKILDYPFAHIHNVNYKGNDTIDKSRKGIRLLKNLKADADVKIDLSSFHLTSVIHSIPNDQLKYSCNNELSIAKKVSEELNNLIQSPTYRKNIKSPNGTEYPFVEDSLVIELKKLKGDLDILIEDTEKELFSPYLQRQILTY